MNEAQHKRARELLKGSEFMELISILEGTKPGMRLCCSGDQAAGLSELVSELGLSEGESAYAVEDEITLGGFVHTSKPAARAPEKEDRRFVYIGADRMTVGLLKSFDMRDNRRFGLTLGYPECCVEFFVRNFSPDRRFDLVPEIGLRKGRPYLSLLNYACRHFGYRLLSHFPCRWDCHSSYDLARRTLQALEKHDSNLAQETLYWLESDVIYSPELVVAVKNTPRNGNILSLREGLFLTTGNLSADAIRFERESAILLQNNRRIGEVRLYQWLPFQSGGSV